MPPREPGDIDGRINDWVDAQLARVKPWVEQLHWGQLLILLFFGTPVLAYVFVPIGYEFWVIGEGIISKIVSGSPEKYSGGTWSQLPVLQWIGLNDASAPDSRSEWRHLILPAIGIEVLTILWWWFGGRKTPPT